MVLDEEANRWCDCKYVNKRKKKKQKVKNIG